MSVLIEENLPKHVAIIMDGNGRWAKQHGLPRALGHRRGVETMRAIVQESSDLHIECLTLYAFSTENWKRTAEEVGTLMGLIVEACRKYLRELDQKNVKIRILGDLDKLPEQQRSTLMDAMRLTEKNTGLSLNFAINYGGRDEIKRGCIKLAKQACEGRIDPESIDERMLSDSLDTVGQPDVDLLIRTGGDLRISNFLLYQSAYAELYFTGILWPDFDTSAYRLALESFTGRKRRFGGRPDDE